MRETDIFLFSGQSTSPLLLGLRLVLFGKRQPRGRPLYPGEHETVSQCPRIGTFQQLPVQRQSHRVHLCSLNHRTGKTNPDTDRTDPSGTAKFIHGHGHRSLRRKPTHPGYSLHSRHDRQNQHHDGVPGTKHICCRLDCHAGRFKALCQERGRNDPLLLQTGHCPVEP